MKKITVTMLLMIISFSTFAQDTKSPTPEQCLRSFARNYLPEYNNKNDFIISKDKKDMAGAVEVINSSNSQDWLKKFAEYNLMFADAVGVVFMYDDEVKLVYTSVRVVNDKCQVKEIAEINTVDISPSKDQTLLSKFFLGKAKNTLPETIRNWVYDSVGESLIGSE